MHLNILWFLLNDKINDKINGKINGKINQSENLIISAIKNNKYITIPEIAKKIKLSTASTYRYLKKLINSNIVRRIESRKAGYCEIIE